MITIDEKNIWNFRTFPKFRTWLLDWDRIQLNLKFESCSELSRIRRKYLDPDTQIWLNIESVPSFFLNPYNSNYQFSVFPIHIDKD